MSRPWYRNQGRVCLTASSLRIFTETRGPLQRKVGLQLRLRKDYRYNRDFPFPQGRNSLLKRPGINPPLMQHGDQSTFSGTCIG
jgi:hypothetical protein